MSVHRSPVARHAIESNGAAAPSFRLLTNFYREEVIRCQQCLEEQREYYSEQTIREVERALHRVMAELDHVCSAPEAGRMVGHLLRQFTGVPGVVNWSDPRHVH
ncbi:MAG: hypothetical protein FJW23_03365 [Acidimicrobiia bacterium]|nr:hypothetical protein [Acidimicrobiia bacterium]